jgi:site-specific DNA-cytosine methylase
MKRGLRGGVMPTLNAFDNGDIRTTVIIFYGNRVDDVRLQGGVINTLQARMGTGGNNMPMIFSHTQGLDIQASEVASPTLRAGGSGMAALIRMREGKPGGGKGPLISEDKSLTIATANDQVLFVQAYDEFNDSVGDTHHTLRSGTKQSTGVITESQVRRLTPVECERLQGFPDDWTAGQSDSARYKQMGNAVAVPVVEWIIQNIVEVADVS